MFGIVGRHGDAYVGSRHHIDSRFVAGERIEHRAQELMRRQDIQRLHFDEDDIVFRCYRLDPALLRCIRD